MKQKQLQIQVVRQIGIKLILKLLKPRKMMGAIAKATAVA